MPRVVATAAALLLFSFGGLWELQSDDDVNLRGSDLFELASPKASHSMAQSQALERQFAEAADDNVDDDDSKDDDDNKDYEDDFLPQWEETHPGSFEDYQWSDH